MISGRTATLPSEPWDSTISFSFLRCGGEVSIASLDGAIPWTPVLGSSTAASCRDAWGQYLSQDIRNVAENQGIDFKSVEESCEQK
jgi:hypothetical protein